MISHAIVFLTIIFKISDGFTGVFWHICDIHLNMSYKTSHDNNEPFGNYISDTTLPLVKSSITAMNKIQPDPDFIIWNGDNVAHMLLDDVNFFYTIRNVSQELRNTFPSTNILPSVGNHDLNNIAESSSWCQRLFKVWESFFSDTKEIELFKSGCYYSRIVNLKNERRKVIVLNTIMWTSCNKAVFNLTESNKQFDWMIKELNDSRREHLKVFIVGHVPPGAPEYTPIKYRHLLPQHNEKLYEILQQNSDIIDAGFFSHQHTDSFKIVYNDKAEPMISLFLSPSVSPTYVPNLGSVNPSIRLYMWPQEASQRSYNQYHTTLLQPHDNLPLLWRLEYNSRTILPSLSATQLDSLLIDLSSPTSRHFERFFQYHLSGRAHEGDERCSVGSVCRCNMVCGMRHIRYSGLEKCLTRCTEGAVSSPSSGHQVPLIVTVIVVFTFVLVVTVVGVNKVYCRHRRTASLTRDIFMASYNGKDCEQIVSDYIDHIVEVTFGDVPEYRGHMRNNSRTILTLNDGNETIDKTQPPISKFAISNKGSKSHEKYDYSRM